MNSTNRSQFFTRLATIAGLTIVLFAWEKVTSRWIACHHPWVFFDLGDTLIDVKSNKGKEVKYFPGAHEYLTSLKSRGYHVGLITNVPETWGPNRHTKVRVLKKEVAQMWDKTKTVEQMVWEDFGDALIFVPPMNINRKPSPYLFKSAINEVVLEEGDTKCPIVYQGEDPNEIQVAKSLGMVAHLVTYHKNSASDPDPGIPQFLELDQLPKAKEPL